MIDIKLNLYNNINIDKIYDVIIIGAGPAGLAAAIYTSRYKLDTLILEKALPGGQMTITEKIENYPGLSEPILGYELSKIMENQAIKFGANLITANVKSITNVDNIKEVNTDIGIFKSKVLILAMGSNPKLLNIPGENEAIGRGVSYCATCDAPFYKNKEVAVIGGGDAAVEEALYLTKFASKVTLIHRRNELRAAKIIQDRLFSNEKINILWNSIPTKIDFQDKVKGIEIYNKEKNENTYLPVDGVFIFIGYIPNTDLVKGLIETDETGYILTDKSCKTNIPGIFACGDVIKKDLYQVATAVGDGATAGFSAYKYLFENSK